MGLAYKANCKFAWISKVRNECFNFISICAVGVILLCIYLMIDDGPVTCKKYITIYADISWHHWIQNIFVELARIKQSSLCVSRCAIFGQQFSATTLSYIWNLLTHGYTIIIQFNTFNTQFQIITEFFLNFIFYSP